MISPALYRQQALFFFVFIPFNILALLSRSLPVVAQIRGDIADPPPPSPHYGTCLHFLSRERFSVCFPRRHASNRRHYTGTSKRFHPHYTGNRHCSTGTMGRPPLLQLILIFTMLEFLFMLYDWCLLFCHHIYCCSEMAVVILVEAGLLGRVKAFLGLNIPVLA